MLHRPPPVNAPAVRRGKMLLLLMMAVLEDISL